MTARACRYPHPVLEFARRTNPRLDILQTSATRGAGLDGWYARLRASVAEGLRALDAR
jgi:Ni2+-binding GTPase involved in maturation of urease and hydrogenase